MKQEKFRTLCEVILAPLIEEQICNSLKDIQGTVDAIAAELKRLGEMQQACAGRHHCVTDADHR
jgi:hypothetical protein